MVAIDATSSRRAVCFEVVNYLKGIGVYQSVFVSCLYIITHVVEHWKATSCVLITLLLILTYKAYYFDIFHYPLCDCRHL